MATRARRRLRGIQEKDRAKCPFTVTALSGPTYEEQDRDAKKRKRDEPVHNQEQSLQESPFAPKGKFKTHQSMNVIYDIEPRKAWYGMTRFNSFKYHGVKYYVGDHIYVMNDITIKRQNAVRTDSRQQGSLQLTDYWVAKILEIRGSDVEHVYARVFWMYLPDELPPNTLLEGKYVSGRQPYHGQHELIASNHMDIINVISVAMPATVNQWLESADDREQRALYWRQAFNCLTPELSSVDLICNCRCPENPDKTLVGCSNPQCGQWLHYECLLHALLTRVYNNLGTEKPHYPGESSAKVVPAVSTRARPDSSKSTTSQRAETESPVVCMELKGGSPGLTEQVHGFSPCSAGFLHSATALQASTEKESELATVTIGASDGTRHAYEGLFEARLDLQNGPTVWKVRDLRLNVSGGDRTWNENVNCLVCGSIIP